MESRGRAGLQPGGGDGGGWVLVEARLQGGAPWGFTLQGGLERGEPLIISKVEEGGKADSLERPLQVGDEIIIINDVELSGFRQEAIALIKGSFKTLRLTVRREFDPGYIEEFVTSSNSEPALHIPSSSSSPSSPPPQQETPPSNHNQPCSAVQLRIKNRRSEPASRPHSWHSTKLGEGRPEFDQAAMDMMSSAWHPSYHASASTTDLSSGFDSGGDYLRKSPDQYSSRGSMESLDPSQSSQLHSGVQNQHPLSHHGHTGSHPAYSSCHQLSSARSSNSIDHLHSKRDSAYSSFSTSSSIPEYLASTPSFSPERSCSLETVPQRGGGSAEMLQADIHFVRTVYDAPQGLSQQHELSSTSPLLSSSDSRGRVRSGPTRDLQGSVGGVCYRGSNSSKAGGSSRSSGQASNRHSVGPIWGPAASYNSYESLKGAPAPPRRSDSYAAIRNHERPNSWSSLEHARSLRSLQKGSWHHSSGPLASAKASFGPDGQLHTVIEKSPESSPTTKPRQGGGFSQPPSPTGPSSGSAGPPGSAHRLLLPTGVYPVPQPEPHFAQIPDPSPDPGPLGVYPVLAKESSRQQQPRPQGINGRGEAPTEGLRDERLSATENGHQSISFTSSPRSSYSASSSSQLRTRAHEADRLPQLESGAGTHKPHIKTTGGEFDGQIGAQRPYNHQESFNQNFQGSHSQEQNQEFRITAVYPGSDLRTSASQEKSDLRDKSRSRDQTSMLSELVASSRLAQGQVRPTCLSPSQPPPQASPRHFSDSAAPQYHHWNHRNPDQDSEHPLTRLEIALAEVQRCTSPDAVFSGGGRDNAGFSNDAPGPARSLSVLEKVSRFERRERGGKQRSQSTNSHSKAAHLRMTEKGHGAPCGAEDLRNMLERSTKGGKAHRTMSYRGGSGDHVKHRTPADSALQRSCSSFQLDGSKEADTSKDLPCKQEIQEIMHNLQDMSSNRSYRESLKDAQSDVLRSTSFRRKDLTSSNSFPSPALPPPVTSSGSQQPPAIPAKSHSLEKKGPKTKPKPQGVVITPQSQALSPHTPKERHVVSPDVRGESPPPLPSVPPVGPPPLTRICGRKRLTADQKKRSYSEPESMNEVGVSDPETSAFFRRGGETSVADRRKMFELAAIRVGSGAFQNAMSRSDLRQVRQDALAEYVERKRGGQRSRSRPRSAFFQPENDNHTDTFSLSSTSSLLSLQESAPDQSFLSEEMRLCSTLPPGDDLRSFQSNFFYPGRVTTPRPPAQPLPRASSGSTLELHTQIYQDLNPEAGASRQGQDGQTAEPQLKPGLSEKLNQVLQRAGSSRRSGRSASAEDLLERLENQPRSPQHHRSRSSPVTEKLDKDLLSEDVKMFGVSFSEPGRCALAADRPADLHTSEGVSSPQPSQCSERALQPAGPSPDLLHTPITRRERQRNIERLRGHSASPLAASVGLPCPLRLSQANLDAITFLDIPQTGESNGDKTLTDRETRHSLSEGSENATKDEYRNRAFSLETTGRRPAENTSVTSGLPPNRKTSESSTSSPPPSTHPSVHQHLSSLRISESSLFSSFDQQQLECSMGKTQEDLDEVFFQNPPPPPLTPLLKETNMTESAEDFPPPPPPLELEAEHHSVQSSGLEFVNISVRKSSPRSSPPPNPPPSSSISTSSTAQDSLVLEYQPLSRREPTSEELRVEALAQQLVLQDPSLAPLLDTWGGKSTVELMGEIFPNCRVTEESTLGGSSRAEEGIQDDTCSPATDQRRETNLDEEETDLNTKKVELCEALRSSVAALQQEKRALCEELQHHQALGSDIEALVQKQLKPNEKEKYNMFIGDLERIVNLLLSLCSRLSRINRSLLSLQRDELMTDDTAEEKDSLHHKRSLLLRQTEDARELKENLDRRQRVVHAILSCYLTEPQLQDYRRFVSAKPALLIRQRHLDDLIRQGEDQLTRLAESLPMELLEAQGGATAGRLSGFGPPSCLVPPSVAPGSGHSVRSTTVTSL